jgi:prephenate dehydratase
MKKVTFLGPIGATFSHDAYKILAELYGTPRAVAEGPDANLVPASTNGEVLKLVLEHGGYGAIAMETLAEGKIAKNLKPFFDMLKTYKKPNEWPIRIIGALNMRFHICLMARKWSLSHPEWKLVGHSAALGACKTRIAEHKFITETVESNGEAARLVAEDDRYARYHALGPRSAAEKYDLTVYKEVFADDETITTFFLIGPKEHKASIGRENRALVVYELSNKPGAYYRSIEPFKELNLIPISPAYTGNRTHDFGIEVEVGGDEIEIFEKAIESFAGRVEEYLSFGPFQVVSR